MTVPKNRLSTWLTLLVLVGAGVVTVVLGVLGYVRQVALAEPKEPVPVAESVATTSAPADVDPGVIFGRVTAVGGGVYEGRLRWGKRGEAFWDDYFDGSKKDNPWAHYLPPDPARQQSLTILGFEFHPWAPDLGTDRPFMERFGDIARIEPLGLFDVRVTLKSGTVADLDGQRANDFYDGVTVWDPERGVVDLEPRQIQAIELYAPDRTADVSGRLYGTVRAGQQQFTGFIQWNRSGSLRSDSIVGQTAAGGLGLPFAGIRAIERNPSDGVIVTRADGSRIPMSGTRDTGRGNRGVIVDNPAYGRVLIPWAHFERVDFTEGPISKAYDAYPAGRVLSGEVMTVDGRRHSGRLVYDLDESETPSTLDASADRLTRNIPFGLIASISLDRPIVVTLHSGERLELDADGDLGPNNAGVLIFHGDEQGPAYVPWAQVRRIDMNRPAGDESTGGDDGKR